MEHLRSRIGVGITTRNRPDVLEYTLRQFDRFTPKDIRIVVVDDNSDDEDMNRRLAEQVGDYHYNEVRLGVAKSKNECIKRLDSDHIFLFDDDCFPTCENWWEPWIVGEHHMVYSPGKGERKVKEHSKEMEGGLGCCLYFSRYCIKAVGGFDPDFGMWGYEHAEITNRISKAGLTSYVYICPLKDNVFSFDYSGSHDDGEGGYVWQSKSSITSDEKAQCANFNAPIFHRAAERMKRGDIKRKI